MSETWATDTDPIRVHRDHRDAILRWVHRARIHYLDYYFRYAPGPDHGAGAGHYSMMEFFFRNDNDRMLFKLTWGNL
jgi:hypothetical protein